MECLISHGAGQKYELTRELLCIRQEEFWSLQGIGVELWRVRASLLKQHPVGFYRKCGGFSE